jgi:UDP-glucose 4-epimerase
LPEHHVILGGCGFLGRHVAILLARAGHRITLVDRAPFPFALPAQLAERIGWRFHDLGSVDWDELLADVDVVHHYAWGSTPASANANPGGDLLSNVSVTIHLLEALRRRGGGRVVFPSSGGTVYGKPHKIPVPEDHPAAPISAYGASKATAEIYLGFYRAMHGLDCRIARIANPYGAGQDISHGLGSITTFAHNAMTAKPIVIWGTGEVVRDFVHIADVARCLVLLARAPRQELFVFNVGSGKGTSLNEIVTILEARLGRSLHVTRTETRAFDVPISVLDISRIRAALGWAPTLSLIDGIDRTIRDLEHKSDFSTLGDCGSS